MLELLQLYWPWLISLSILLIGIGWLLGRSQWKQRIPLLQEEIKHWKANHDKVEQELAEEKTLHQQAIQERTNLREQLVALQKDLTFAKKQLHQREQDEQQLQQQFELIANKVLEENGNTFSKKNQEQLQHILNPLREHIQQFEKKVKQSHESSIERHASLKQELSHLKELNQTISEEAQNLTNALKGETRTQGNWGELILETVLQKSGLEKDREYTIQESIRDSDGNRKQPDVIIHLPNEKRMVIDSKVSLTAYERLVNEEEEKQAAQYFNQHRQSVRRHIKQLAQKNYHQLYDIKSPDFVLLFIPIETAFSTLIREDHQLYEWAFDQNIVIVTPTTLLATLKTIDSLWQNEKQRKNTLKIANEAGKMYDKFVGFVDDIESIGQRIKQTDKAYHAALNKLSTGHGNLVSRAEKLKKLGAKANKQLDTDHQNSS